MRLSTLQLGLVIAGVLLVLGVVAYNAWQVRRARRRLEGATRPPGRQATMQSFTRSGLPMVRITASTPPRALA